MWKFHRKITITFSKETIKNAIENGIIYPDGHSIINPEHYEGFDVTEITEVHHSDFSSPTTTIWGHDGEPKESMEGVYNLTFLYWVANQTEMEAEGSLMPYGGRGSNARHIVKQLVEWSGADPDVTR